MINIQSAHSQLGSLIRADIQAANPNFAHLTGARFWMRALAKTCVSANVRVVLMYRFAHVLATHGLRPLALLIRSRGIRISGAEINPEAEIGPGLYLAHSVGAGIGSYVRIGRNCRLHLGAVIGPQPSGHSEPQYVTIGDDVYVGTHAVVVGGVTIGDGATIGANAVVMRDIPPRAIVAGSPGRVVGERNASDPRP